MCDGTKMCYSSDRKYHANLEDSDHHIKVNIYSGSKKIFSQKTHAGTHLGGGLAWRKHTLILHTGDIGRLKFMKFKGKWIQLRANEYIAPSGNRWVKISYNSRKNKTVSIKFWEKRLDDNNFMLQGGGFSDGTLVLPGEGIGDDTLLFPASSTPSFYIVTSYKVKDVETSIKWLSNSIIEMPISNGQSIYYKRQKDASWQEVKKQKDGSWKIVNYPVMTMKKFRINVIIFTFPDLLSKVLKLGADINFKEPSQGNTIFMEPCARGNIPYIKLLLENNVNVNAVNSDNENAFFRCVGGSDFSPELTIKFLLNNTDIKINQINSMNETPLDVAILFSRKRVLPHREVHKKTNLRIIKLLKKHGAKTAAELKAKK
jgi:hypothetical protein